MKIKILPRAGGYEYSGDDGDEFGGKVVPLGEPAISTIRRWGDIFCGFGAYCQGHPHPDASSA